MTNAFYLLVYSTALIISIIFLITLIAKKNKNYLVRHCTMLFICLVGWTICEMLFFSLKDVNLIPFFFDLKIGFISFLAVYILLTVVGFYGLDRHMPKWLTPALMVIPCITMLLAITTQYHPLIMREFRIVSTSPFTIAEYTRGWWYNVHFAYMQLMALCFIGIVVWQYRNLPKAYQGGISAVFVCFILYIAGLIIELIINVTAPPDFNLLCTSAAGYCLCLAATLNGRTDYPQLGSDDILNYIDEAVFILNDDGHVISRNAPAQVFLDQFDSQIGNLTFDKFLMKLDEENHISFRPALEHAHSRDIYLIGRKYALIYQMERRTVFDEIESIGGEIITLTDVTRNRVLIDLLKQMAGVDQLTGVLNRYRYHELLRELDHPENLPLGILVSDVNGLKQTNDQYGHTTGDQLLKIVAGVLMSAKPKNGYIARIGGDEFMMLVPNCTDRQMRERIIHIQQALMRSDNLPINPTLAMGYAIKYDPEENIKALVYEADREMYGEK